jgi:ABC-type phosphate transport system substrate-binding protein
MRSEIRLILGLCVALAVARPVAAQTSAFNGFNVIGNTTGVTSLTEEDASAIFRGKKSVWSNGKPILIVLPSTKNPSSAIIARNLFSTDAQGMHRYWLSQVFQGRANAPVFLERWEDVVQRVTTVEGAVAVVPKGVSVPTELIIPIR